MKRDQVKVPEVVEVFHALGGEATRGEFLQKLSTRRGDSYEPYKDKKNFETTAWQVVQERCPGYKKYKGETRLFKQVGHGKCRLLEVDIGNSVSSEAERADLPDGEPGAFQFFAKSPSALSEAAPAQLVETQRKMILDHNKMQGALYNRLVLKFGKMNVGCENFTHLRTRIDLVVKLRDKHLVYEIKTDPSPRVCLRQAIGQLLEYSYAFVWSSLPDKVELIVVGKTPIDKEGNDYLRFLEKEYKLSIEYEQVEVDAGEPV